MQFVVVALPLLSEGWKLKILFLGDDAPRSKIEATFFFTKMGRERGESEEICFLVTRRLKSCEREIHLPLSRRWRWREALFFFVSTKCDYFFCVIDAKNSKQARDGRLFFQRGRVFVRLLRLHSKSVEIFHRIFVSLGSPIWRRFFLLFSTRHAQALLFLVWFRCREWKINKYHYYGKKELKKVWFVKAVLIDKTLKLLVFWFWWLAQNLLPSQKSELVVVVVVDAERRAAALAKMALFFDSFRRLLRQVQGSWPFALAVILLVLLLFPLCNALK